MPTSFRLHLECDGWSERDKRDGAAIRRRRECRQADEEDAHRWPQVRISLDHTRPSHAMPVGGVRLTQLFD